MQFTMYTAILLISWMAAKMNVGSTMTTGQLMSMIVYATQILSSLMLLSMVFVMIIMAESSANRIVEVLDEESDLKNPAHPLNSVADGSIDFDNVSFSYVNDPDKSALKDINIHIHSGETIGIIGGTGSAKTMLVQMIPRLYDTTTGQVRVGGKDVRDYDIESLRDQVSVVLQKTFCSPAPSKKTFAGVIRMLRMKNWLQPASLLRQTNLYAASRMDMTPILNRAEPTSPVVRNNVSVSPAPC